MKVYFPDAIMAKKAKCGLTVWLSGFVTDAVAMSRLLNGSMSAWGNAVVVCHKHCPQPHPG